MPYIHIYEAFEEEYNQIIIIIHGFMNINFNIIILFKKKERNVSTQIHELIPHLLAMGLGLMVLLNICKLNI